jgi:hypothetical protein
MNEVLRKGWLFQLNSDTLRKMLGACKANGLIFMYVLLSCFSYLYVCTAVLLSLSLHFSKGVTVELKQPTLPEYLVHTHF